jgi:hypothetical protein
MATATPTFVAVPLGADWVVEAEVVNRSGVATIRQLRVVPAHSERDGELVIHGAYLAGEPVPDDAYIGDGLTVRQLREIRIQPLLAGAVEPVRIRGQDGRLIELQTELSGMSSRTPRRGARLGDRELVELAARYLDLVKAGSRTPVQDLLRSADVKYSAAGLRDALAKARSRGLLTRSPRGRAGGELTAAALQLLGRA